MEEQTQHQNSLADELARKDRQLELLRQAYTELQQINAQHQQQAQYAAPIQNDSYRENILKTVNHLPTFTGTGEVTINSFFSSIEYLLSTIADENIRKEAVRTIFYKTIQGQAKEVIINIPTPDNWELIKETLKLRYRPSVEPHQLYKMIANLKVNNNQYRQGPVEPMEIDNINLNMNRPQRAGHPNPQIGQNRLISDRQSQEEICATNNRREEINNCVFL
ncbi:hypothetical protein EVAR_103919_1 [Eumeta japonica]|uniref:Uncharacterized protein n=1 Tax=Eumeta variegata TaxID=151549 RepID=A0A4C1SQ37_EUMVA|nr:hypothetical protein EVAR_103919_1 [Eumeta japonica]